ncbi:MAG: DUF805 domain-containing protein [Brevundimonas sp.]|uniref:DUF805 domain-containing protein n=1 Tax=Brevundimonas sp. TaxID=1871086 RepID=UPI002ABBB360|nr:DUF805 domain-containing protein [Brevundimonas sp.]MDZ4112936.1 DUF805 domain-containing protein [Brevundimonas sp.]
MNWFPLFLSLDGRIGRKDFWVGAVALIGVGILANLLPIVGPLVSLVLIAPWTCLLVKRLHDFGRSGWLVLIALVPAAGSAVLGVFTALAASNVATMGAAFAGAGLTLVASSVALIVSLGFLIWVGAKPGDLQPNAYGPAANHVG